MEKIAINKFPLGIKLLVIMLLLTGIYMLISFVLALPNNIIGIELTPYSLGGLLGFMAHYFVLIVACIVGGIGLFRFKKWGAVFSAVAFTMGGLDFAGSFTKSFMEGFGNENIFLKITIMVISFLATGSIVAMLTNYMKNKIGWALKGKFLTLGILIIFAVVLAFKIYSAVFATSSFGNIPINEKPMYGNTAFTQKQKEANDRLIKEAVETFGSKEAACKEAMDTARYYAQKDDLKTAMRRANQAWLLDPNNAEVYYLLGSLTRMQGKTDETISLYEKALELNPNHVMVMCNLGRQFYNKAQEIYRRQGKKTSAAIKYLDDAISFYDKASRLPVQNNDDLGYIYYQWACALLFKENYAESWKKVKLSRKYSDHFIEPGFINELSGFMAEPEEEAASPEKPPETKPDESKTYFYEAAAQLSNKQYDEAISNFTKAIEINPNYADAYFQRGVAYGMKGLHDQAISDSTKAIELAPANAYAYYNRGYGYYKKGMYNEAIADYDKAIKLKPYEASYYLSEAAACDSAGLSEQAKEAYKKFLKISPYGSEADISHAKERIKQLTENK